MKHAERAALDAAKMLWLHYKKKVDDFVDDEEIRRLCLKVPDNEFLKSYQLAEELARQARQDEVANTGKNPSSSLEKYYQAAQSFQVALGQIDSEKSKYVRRFKVFNIVKNHVISFVLGVFASLSASLIWWI